VEQSGAPAVLLHRPELARQTADQPPVIIEPIAATTTSTGLKVYARLGQNDYPKGVKITDRQLAAVNITRHTWRPEWNYRIAPTNQPL